MAKLGPVSRVLSITFVQARGSLRRVTPHVMKVMPFSVLSHFLAHFCVSSCAKYESGKSWTNSIPPST
ncbi:hypothetical protein HanXRQr2_Chr13g0615031 [Helianthus annuus]|uniref:Uncharacterized protein n=1 Tax=Helianthus annuus TaxID=4232 RepID=A0A9K3EL84_HELAN|nr:hypothetical protein HanXRQr2_Chr13g0615031 [Helianthus annuus]